MYTTIRNGRPGVGYVGQGWSDNRAVERDLASRIVSASSVNYREEDRGHLSSAAN